MRLLWALFAVGTAQPRASLPCQLLGTRQGRAVGLQPEVAGGESCEGR